MKIHRIKAFLLRHLYPMRRDFDLLSDLIYWPIIDIILWGVTSQWLVESSGVPYLLTSILIGLILWNVIWRSQAEVSRNLMDEIWDNNLVNIFSTPLTIQEWITGVLGLAVIKTIFSMTLLIPLVYFLYQVNVFIVGWWLLLHVLITTITGWSIGFLSAGIVLRYGPKVQTVIWTLPGILLPFSAIYFPLAKLPVYLQPISYLIPTTYSFEMVRGLLSGVGIVYWYPLVAMGLNVIYLSLAIWWFVRSFRSSCNLGLGRFD